MAARSMEIQSYNHGVIQIGTIENVTLPIHGYEGFALSRDSYPLGLYDFRADAQSSYVKAHGAGYTFDDIAWAINNLPSQPIQKNSSEEDLPDTVKEMIEIIEGSTQWLWGGVWEGGVGITCQNDMPLMADCHYVITVSHGIYEDATYWYLETEIADYRDYDTFNDVVIVYKEDSDKINMACREPLTTFEVKGYLPGVVSPFIGDYEVTGHTKDIIALNSTRATVPVSFSPYYVHSLILNGETVGGLDDPNGWLDDLNYPIPGVTKVSGSWTGDGELEPQQHPEGGKEQGGNPIYTPSSEPSGKTEEDQFEIDAINSGLVTIYNPTQQEIIEFTNFLFSGITEDASAFIKRLVSSPLEYLISLSMVHYHPKTENTAEIKFGGLGSGVVSKLVSEQITKIDCGTIGIAGEYDAFLDYGGLTHVKINIPYCGKFDLDPDLVMNSNVNLTYYIDNLSGACLAQIQVFHATKFENDRPVKETRYEYSGNVFQQVPLSASDYRSAVMGILTAVGGVGAIASGNVVSGISSVASGIMSMKPTIHHSGEAGSNFGYLGSQKAYIEVTRPNPSLPPNFSYREGRPSNTYVGKLSECHKFTQVDDGTYIVNNINCTDTERKMIKDLLESGVILP